MIYKRVCLSFYKFFPPFLRTYFSSYLTYSGIEDHEFWIGRMLLFSLFLSFVFSFATYLHFSFAILLILFIFFLSFLLSILIHFFYLVIKSDNRAQEVERHLPEFLLLVISNLRSGLSPYSSLVSAGRSEFGILGKEVSKLSSKLKPTEPFFIALDRLSSSFDSPTLRRVTLLIYRATQAGGKLTDTLEAIVDELKRLKALREELYAQIKGYIMFISLVVVIITPFIFALGSKFVETTLSFHAQSKELSKYSYNQFFSPASVDIDSAFVETLALVYFFFTSLFFSLFYGLIKRGKPVLGLKYLPLVFLASIVMFYISKLIISAIILPFKF